MRRVTTSEWVRRAVAGTVTSMNTYVVLPAGTVGVEGVGVMPVTHHFTPETLT